MVTLIDWLCDPARLVGLVAMAFNLYGFGCKSSYQSKMYFCTSSLFWAVQSFLLGALSGTALILITALRQGASAFFEDSSKKKRIQLSAVFSGLALVGYLLTTPFDEKFRWISLVPLTAAVLGTWTLFVLNNIQMRVSLYAVNLSWLFYALNIGSWELATTSVVACLINYFNLRRLKGLPVFPRIIQTEKCPSPQHKE